MDFTAHVLYRMIHYLMLELIKAVIRFQRIGEECRTG
jgi:hypothetical protein